MTKTAVAAPERPRKLYVLRLEEAVRSLDRLMPVEITAEHPEDHGLDPEVARLVVSLRKIDA